MSHENSATYRGPDGLYYNISLVTGKPLQGPFKTMEDAVWHARVRSSMQGEFQLQPELGDLSEVMDSDYKPETPEAPNYGPPRPIEFGPLEKEDHELFQSGPGIFTSILRK